MAAEESQGRSEDEDDAVRLWKSLVASSKNAEDVEEFYVSWAQRVGVLNELENIWGPLTRGIRFLTNCIGSSTWST